MPKVQVRGAVRTQQRGQERSRAQLEAASALFVEKGFEATSLNDVIDRAGGSRTTLYKRFGDKDGLFRAMMEEHCNRIQEDMVKVLETNAELAKNDPENILCRIGLHIVEKLFDPKTSAILRTLVSEGRRVPDISREFIAMGSGRSIEKIAEYLHAVAESNGVAVGNTRVAAEAFFSMVIGSLLLRRLIMPDEPVDLTETEDYVRQSVRVFLRGWLNI